MNLVGAILSHARTRPDAPALIDRDRTIDYRELAELVTRAGGRLAAIGVQRGDRIGLCLRDTSTHIVTLLAVAGLGAVAVPLDWRARASENIRLLEGLGVARVFAEPDTRLAPGCEVIAIDAAWQRAASLAEPFAAPATDWLDPFVISATSGSTGAPKLVLATHLNYFFRISSIFELMRLTGRHRYLATAPLCYTAGRARCLAHLLRGDAVILHPSLFAPTEYVDVANRQKASIGFLLPSVARQLLAIAGEQPMLPRFAALIAGGGPLDAEEKRAALHRLTPNFSEAYGTTEAGLIAGSCPDDLVQRPDSIGRPHSVVEIEVVGEDDRPLPAGGIGRLRCRGPTVGSPLSGAAGKIDQANFRDCWHYPGEIAWLDDRSYIFLRGRVSDVIIRGGAKIYPAEVENALREHPDVIEAAVIGRSTVDNHEEDIVAFVVVGRALPTAELVAHCRTRLTPYKVPREIHLVARLPLSPAGKTDKAALARRLAENATERSR
jgi:acyl-coenzyme A synthetase/AMP-(fatty) acid ligase